MPNLINNPPLLSIWILLQDSSWIENLQVADLDQTVVETDEDYQDDYYDVVADIDIRSQPKPRRGGKSGGYNGK